MNKDQKVMVEKGFQEIGTSILNSLVLITFDVRVGAGQLFLRTSVNGNLFRLSLPVDSDGLRIAKHVFTYPKRRWPREPTSRHVSGSIQASRSSR